MRNTARNTRHTPADDLRVVLDNWQHLRALVDSSTPAQWPPIMGTDTARDDDVDPAVEQIALALSHPQRLVTRTDRHGRPAYECAFCDRVGDGGAHPIRDDRGPGQLAELPAPVRLHVVDACAAIEAELCELADQIAAEVQRPVITAPDPAWSPADRRRRSELADEDAADERRWHYTRTCRTAPRAAQWLLDRLDGAPGICAPITGGHRVRIAAAARAAAERIERTLGAERRHVPMPDDRPCPWCGGALMMHRGGTDTPVVTCETGAGCGAPVPLVDGRRTWKMPQDLLKLREALDAAARRRRRAAARRRQRAAARAAFRKDTAA